MIASTSVVPDESFRHFQNKQISFLIESSPMCVCVAHCLSEWLAKRRDHLEKAAYDSMGAENQMEKRQQWHVRCARTIDMKTNKSHQ